MTLSFLTPAGPRSSLYFACLALDAQSWADIVGAHSGLSHRGTIGRPQTPPLRRGCFPPIMTCHRWAEGDALAAGAATVALDEIEADEGAAAAAAVDIWARGVGAQRRERCLHYGGHGRYYLPLPSQSALHCFCFCRHRHYHYPAEAAEGKVHWGNPFSFEGTERDCPSRVHAGEGVGEEAEAAEGGAGVAERTAATGCNAGRNCF